MSMIDLKNLTMDIYNGNELIVRFMGAYAFGGSCGSGWVCVPIPENRIIIETLCLKNDGELEYHSSWDWFMSAWKKFRNLQGQRMPEYINHVRSISVWIEKADINEAFKHLVKGIEWYNEQFK